MRSISPTWSMSASGTLRLFYIELVNSAGSGARASPHDHHVITGPAQGDGWGAGETADIERAHGCAVAPLPHRKRPTEVLQRQSAGVRTYSGGATTGNSARSRDAGPRD